MTHIFAWVVLASLFTMLVFSFVAWFWNLQPAPDLEACAKEHNVYQCQLVAVPVNAPEWLERSK